ncbi:MAG: leucine-rich repeat protein [Methanomassiliicoccaceae archaeon]|nr:leucine-rich repeat protein [Methanomassiliicoccaceae archaeon]
MIVAMSLMVVTLSAFLLTDNESTGASYDVTGYVDGTFTYSLDTTAKEAMISDYSGIGNTVSIPDFIVPTSSNPGSPIYNNTAQYPVTVIGTSAFEQEVNITVLTMGANVKTIQEKAFRECTGIATLDLKNVEEVGAQAFVHCTSLTQLRADNLIKIGDGAFAILNVINTMPYTGSIPYMNSLSLPKAEIIGAAAFGTANTGSLYFLARDFGTVNLPSAVSIGDYAFSQAQIENSLNIASAETIGYRAFYWAPQGYTDVNNSGNAVSYSISIPEVKSIGSGAFMGRGITGVTFPSSTLYTIDTYAFAFTQLQTAELGMVSSVGLSAFDDIRELEYFAVDPANTKYASLISSNPANNGERGALYQLDGSGDPSILIKLPPAIRPLLSDHGYKFTVANGATGMLGTACKWCPSISVDLNGITDIPASAFSNSEVLQVTARNANHVGHSAFAYCTSLSSFDFLDAGGSLLIEENAFLGTSLEVIDLPKDTTIGNKAFSALVPRDITLSIWGDTVITDGSLNGSFLGTYLATLRVSSDAAFPATVTGAENIYDNWNVSGCSYGGSNSIGLLIVDNTGDVDISELKPNGTYNLQIISFADFSPASLGVLQFVEFKDSFGANPAYHRMSAKGGVYSSESHPGPGPIMLDLAGTTPSGKSCAAGDGMTWELIHEYYLINFYSFPTDTIGGNGIPVGDDPDYTNAFIDSEDMSAGARDYIDTKMYLSGQELRSLLYVTFVRYHLEGWYTADDPNHALATMLTNNKVMASNGFAVAGPQNIPESWIYRDPVTDQGILNLYAVFGGKEYRIEVEVRQTGGQQTSGSFGSNPDGTGGTINLVLDTPPMGYFGFGTTTSNASGYGDYPYGTQITLQAIPQPGYAFVGWALIDIGEEQVVFDARNDRSYVNSMSGTATWSFTIPSAQFKFVAYFAKVTNVVFDFNDGRPTANANFVVGDRLTETNNAYGSHNYGVSLNNWLVGIPTANLNTAGNGTPYYPGVPVNAIDSGLAFGGWYSGTTEYNQIPSAPNPLNIRAKWLATIDFYTNDGTNGNSTLTGTGLVLNSPGVYSYLHDVGVFASGSYSGVFSYGASYSPAIPDISFNGWYVLASTGTGFGDIVADGSGNSGTPYQNLYPTLKRLEPGTVVGSNISLIALYSADVEIYFNGGVDSTSVIDTTIPYTVAVPVSKPTYFDDALFSTLHGKMPAVNSSTGDITKDDVKGAGMAFVGWFVTADGSTMPVASDATFITSPSATAVVKNVKLIAGWGLTVSFDDGGQTGILKGAVPWVPASDEFYVLEGTAFSMADMPGITSGGNSPTAWYDASTTPYTWFDSSVEYTYSVTLIPAFGSIFAFNMMGGTPALGYVSYMSSDTFGDVLQRFIDSLYDNSSSSYVDLSKAGLYYMTDGGSYGLGPGMPDAAWYKGDSGSAPDYINGTPVKWNLSDSINPANNTAYIRWLADVSFDRNVDVADVDAGTTAIPAKISGVDENTPYTMIDPFDVLQYNTDKDRTFKGWYNGTSMYADQNGDAVTGLLVTGSVTLTARWVIEVKYYYTGLLATVPAGATLSSDADGNYVIVEVGATGSVAAPTLTKTGFTANNILWYEGGWTASAPVYLDGALPSTPIGNFDPRFDMVFKNKTVYGIWYAKVEFVTDPLIGGGFFSSVKYMMEGLDLSDLLDELRLSDPNEDLDPFRGDPMRTDWVFVGWFHRTYISVPLGYNDVGQQYYRTSFNYGSPSNPPSAPSTSIMGDVVLYSEHVVEVKFEAGYDPSAPIDTRWLRVNMPIPGSGHRFTPMPVRPGATFVGWIDMSAGKLYSDFKTDQPNSELVLHAMTLTAGWLVEVRFYDPNQYLADGLVLSLHGNIVMNDGPDGIPGTADDYLEMPAGTRIREFIAVDPSQPGKTFVSWFVEQGTPDGIYSSGDVSLGINDMILTDTILTAGYGFELSFDTKGGTPSSIPNMMVIEGQSVDLPEKPAKGRLTFGGWDDGSALFNAEDTVTPAGNTVYTAKWMVTVIIYDGVSMTPVTTVEWDEDAGPPAVSPTPTVSPDYDNKVISLTLSTASGNVTVEKFIDRYDPSVLGWVQYYSVLSGWIDPFTGTTWGPDMAGLFSSASDSTAVFANWQERVRIDDGNGSSWTGYLDTGTYLLSSLTLSGLTANGWAEMFNPTSPVNPDTYRIRDSTDFVAITYITLTLNANGGTPQQQVIPNIAAGTMLGAVPATEPTRSGMFFAGWYDGSTKYSFTNKLYQDTTLTAMWQSTPPEVYVIFATAYSNAFISPQGMIRVMAGDSVTFDFYASVGNNPKVLIDGREVNVTSPYTFANVRGNHSIEISADGTLRDITGLLTVNVNGHGDVLYSTDGGIHFAFYDSPLPLFSGAEYVLKAVPGQSSQFVNWSGDASGSDPQITIVSDGTSDLYVNANFENQSGIGSGFFGTHSGGGLSIANLICMILAVAIGIVALTVANNRNYEGTGTGKGLRLGAVIIALISVALFFLTQGFNGTFVPTDEWTIVMAILTLVTAALALISLRYDYAKEEDAGSGSSKGMAE